jgi:hypothetical protein
MTANRALTIITVAIVLLVAWYASREELEIGIAVAIFGLALTYSHGVLGVPAAGLMAVAALHVSGVVVVVVLLVLLMLIARMLGPAAPRGSRLVGDSLSPGGDSWSPGGDFGSSGGDSGSF